MGPRLLSSEPSSQLLRSSSSYSHVQPLRPPRITIRTSQFLLPPGPCTVHLTPRDLALMRPLRPLKASTRDSHTVHALFPEPCTRNIRAPQGPAFIKPLRSLRHLEAHSSQGSPAINVRLPGGPTAKPWRRKDPVPAVRLPPVLSPGAGALLRTLLRPGLTNEELHRALESASQQKGGAEDIQAALAHVRKEKQWAAAIEVYEWLLLTGLLRPDVRTFNLILEAYGQSGQPHKCAALFQAMQEGTAVVQETVRGWGAQARAVTSHSAPVTSHSVPVTIHSGPVASGGTTVTAQPEPLFQEEDSGESAEGPGAGQGHTGEEGRAAVEEEGHEERVEETGAASEAPLAVGGTPPVQGAQAGSEEGAEAQVSGGRVLAEGACIPSEASWNVLIAAYCQAGLLKEADAAFQDMKARGYTPSLVTYNTMLEVYGSAGEVGAAERIFSRIERGRKEGPTVNSFTLMIAAYARVGWASKAEALFRRMYEVSLIPDRGTFLALMSAYASCDMARSAAAAFQGMLRMGQAQSQSQSHSQATDVASCNALLAAHLAHPEEALSLLRSMADLYGVEPDASSYQLVSEALAAAGMWQELDALLASIPQHVTAGKSAAEVEAQRRQLQAVACARGGEPEGLEVHLREMEETEASATGSASSTISGKEANVLRLTALGRSGKLEELFALLERLQKEQEREDEPLQGGPGGAEAQKVEILYMNALVEALGVQGDLEKAEELFSTLPALTGSNPGSASYAALMAGPAQRKNLRKCLGLLKRMGAEGVPVDAAVRRALLGACRSEAQEDEVYEALFSKQGNKKKKYALY